jgi:hypothetical protein
MTSRFISELLRGRVDGVKLKKLEKTETEPSQTGRQLDLNF